MLGRDEFVDLPFGHARRPQLPTAPAGLRQLEERRLGLVPHDRRTRGPPTGGRFHDDIGYGITALHRTTLSSVRTNPSTSARVRRSVTATSNPCTASSATDRSVALVADEIGQGQPTEVALVGQAFDGHAAGNRQPDRELAQVGVTPVIGSTPLRASIDSRQNLVPRAQRSATSRSPVVPEPSQLHRGVDRHQRLVRAHVGGGLLAPDVLFARPQGGDVGPGPLDVHRLAHQPPRQPAHVLRRHREEPEIRTAEAQRGPESLAFAHDHVGPALPG